MTSNLFELKNDDNNMNTNELAFDVHQINDMKSNLQKISRMEGSEYSSKIKENNHNDYIKAEYYYLKIAEDITIQQLYAIIKYVYANESMLTNILFASIINHDRAYKMARNKILEYNGPYDEYFVECMNIYLITNNKYKNDVLDICICALIDGDMDDEFWSDLLPICLKNSYNHDVNEDNILLLREIIISLRDNNRGIPEYVIPGYVSFFACIFTNYVNDDIIYKMIDVVDDGKANRENISTILSHSKMNETYLNYLKKEIIINNLVDDYLNTIPFAYAPTSDGTLGKILKYTRNDFYKTLPNENEIGIVL